MRCSNCQAEIASHHAFCMTCGTRVATPPAGRADSAGTVRPVAGEQPVAVASSSRELASQPTVPSLEVREMSRLRAGTKVTLVGRVRWELGSTTRALLEVASTAPHRSETTEFPGLGWSTFTFELRPERAGSCHLLFRVEATGSSGFRGELVLPVDAATDAGPVIQIHNQQSNDARIAVGQEAHINVNVAGKQERSWTDEARYHPIELLAVGAGGAARVAGGIKRPVDGDTPPASIVTRLSLRIRQGRAVRNICLYGGTSLRLGKQRGNDVVLRVLPPGTPEFDQLWGRISRNHAEVRFTTTGAEWRNGACANGTLVEGRLLGADQSVALRPVHAFRPADALELRCTLITDGTLHAAGDAYSRFERDLGATTDDHQPIGPLAAIRVNRVQNFDHLEEYILVQRGCTLGSDAGNGIVISDPSVSMRHALVLFNRHGFWLEPIQRQSPTLHDGEQVPPHRLVRLVPGMSPLRFGDVEVAVSACQQWCVDVPLP